MSPEERFKKWYKKNCGHYPIPENEMDDLVLTAMNKAWLEATRQAYEDAISICKYREDLQIRTCGEDRANEARCCAEDIQARLKGLSSGPKEKS